MSRVRIHVTLKDGVLDPQGKTVENALAKMGHKNIENVRIGKYIELEAKGTAAEIKKQVDEICDKLLANHNIEKYTFEID